MIPSFGNIIYTLGAFIVALSIIVAVHEYGHYIVGRWSGIHAEVFSLGFGPRLASWRDRRGTLWQISLLPLGGYVKFLGDADAASSGADQGSLSGMSAAELRRTMHAAPLWARAATVAAGPVFNFVLAVFVFAMVVGWQGQAVAPLTIERILPMPETVQELRPGDVITEIHGKDISDLSQFNAVISDLPKAPSLDYKIQRDGETLLVPGPFPYPPVVASVSPQSAALAAGLEKGDYILAIDGTPLGSFEDLRSAVMMSEGEALNLTIWRDGDEFPLSLTPKSVDYPSADGGFETRYMIGVAGDLFFEPVTEFPGPFTALKIGISQTGMIIEQSLSGLYHVLTGAISSCNLQGPIGIAETSGAVASQGLVDFIWFIGVLSAAVGLLNLFPVPVLDGGHLVFFGYEAITGRPPNDKVLRVLMATGLALILSLMVFALSNDVFCP